eukprot:13833096-Alexandrium_andersonii.AAC.1
MAGIGACTVPQLAAEQHRWNSESVGGASCGTMPESRVKLFKGLRLSEHELKCQWNVRVGG